jgi:hypothetical protein
MDAGAMSFARNCPCTRAATRFAVEISGVYSFSEAEHADKFQCFGGSTQSSEERGRIGLGGVDLIG